MVVRVLAGEEITDLAARSNGLYLGAFQSFMPMWENPSGWRATAHAQTTPTWNGFYVICG